MNKEEMLKKENLFYKRIIKVLIFLLIFVLVATPITLALYKDYFTQDLNTVDFGNVTINVTDGVTDSQTVEFHLNRTGTNQENFTKAMPGDEVTISIKLSLASGSEPCYYIVNLSSPSQFFGENFNADYFSENGNVYKIDSLTPHRIDNENITTSNLVGRIDSGSVTLNLSATIPITANEDDIEELRNHIRATCNIYAVQQANLTQQEAYYAINGMYEIYYYCNEDGTPHTAGDHIAFGKYPQTLKSSDVTITNGPDEDGYYTGSDEEQYVLQSSKYYKVEPILWQILNVENGNALLLSKKIIDGVVYQPGSNYTQIDGIYYLKSGIETYDGEISDGTEYANNYKFSYLRTWLNTTFLKKALTPQQRNAIQTTIVDNSKATTYSNSNQYVPEDYTTSDKVFALSYQEYMNTRYFANNEARQKLCSDYAKIKGVYTSGNGSYCWTRSPRPAATGEDIVSNLWPNGSINGRRPSISNVGVQPALVLSK